MAIRWLIDVGPLWNSPSEFAAALALIPQQCARNDIEKYHHLNDRKLALASQILQRLCVSIVTSSSSSPATVASPVKFKDVVLTRENNAKGGKPITPSPVQFNVSHHGRVVACVARHSSSGKVGVDVVDVTDGGVPGYVKKRKGSIYSGEGVKSWVEGFGGMEGGVFTDGEMKGIFNGYAAAKDGSAIDKDEGEVSVEDKLLSKKLYRNWCAKEAYVKAVGTGLVTELGRLEIRGVEGFSVTGSDKDGEEEKTRYLGVEAWTRESGSDTWTKDTQWRFDMERVKAGAEEYYVCAALECDNGRCSSPEIEGEDREGAWRFLDFERDILEVIRSQS